MTTEPVPEPAATARVRAAVAAAVDGYPVEVTAAITAGPPEFRVQGAPGIALREIRDRIRAAVINSDLPWPEGAITVALHPGQLPGGTSGLDLPIAIAVLAAAGTVPGDGTDGCVLVAGLGLDGSLRPVPGVLPALLAAARAVCTRAVVAAGNGAEAVTVPGLTVIPCQSLRAVAVWLRSEALPADSAVLQSDGVRPAGWPRVSLARLGVAPVTRLALEASAAGGHHLCLTGPRDAWIPDLAAGLAALLQPLTYGEMLEVSAVRSAAGLPGSGHGLVTRPPFRALTAAATPAALAGGGPGTARPGEAALAHRGVLFLENAAEFARHSLAVLRQPLTDREITVSRAGRTVTWPAWFTLVAGSSPCPCQSAASCSCTPLQARRYRARLVGELGGYIPLRLTITRLRAPGAAPGAAGDADARSAARVAEARDRARRRLAGTPWRVNSDIPGGELRRRWHPPDEALAAVTRAVDLGEISIRAASQVIRVAWTLADLAGSDRPGAEECGQALAFQLGVAR